MTDWKIWFGVLLLVCLSRSADSRGVDLPDEANDLETKTNDWIASTEQFGNKEALIDSNSNHAKYPPLLWTAGVVYYYFDAEFSEHGRKAVAEAMAFYEANTCILFKEVDPLKWTGIIRIYAGAGCESAGIGRPTNTLNLSLGNGCERMASLELGHALGLYNEQSRHDRDAWITVDLDNVAESDRSQFRKSDNSYDFELRYDFRSIMHSKPRAFGIDQSKPVMVAHDPRYQMAMGASHIPVFTDIAQLNKLYSCDACAPGEFYTTVATTKTIECAHGGYPNPNDCTKCLCPSGFGGDDCTQRQADSPGLNCGQTIAATKDWQTLKQNNVCGNGEQTTADRTNPSLCTYHIQAPVGHRIEYWVNFVGFDGRNDALCHDQCAYGGLDLKGHDLDLRPEGYRLCCPSQLAEKFHTAGDLLVVQAFNNFRYTDFQIMYRIDPCGATLTATPHFQWFASNHVVGTGHHETGDRNNPTTCTWTIEAPEGSQLLYAVNFVGFDGNRSALCYWDCWYGAVEVQGDERLKFCCPQQDNQLVRNEGNKLTVTVTNIFRYTEFKIQYAIDPCANVPTTCWNGGVSDPNNCERCECLPGFAERIAPSAHRLPGARAAERRSWQRTTGSGSRRTTSSVWEV